MRPTTFYQKTNGKFQIRRGMSQVIAAFRSFVNVALETPLHAGVVSVATLVATVVGFVQLPVIAVISR